MKTVTVNRKVHFYGALATGDVVTLSKTWRTVWVNSEFHLEFKTSNGEWITDDMLVITVREEFSNECSGEQEATFPCGISRAAWHDKAWALYHARTFDDVALGKLSIHTIRAVFDATYDALKTPNNQGKRPGTTNVNEGDKS